MSLLRWLLAYFFDCVHPHITWPHRDRTGLAYVCCLDCGRELPYSLRRMTIVTAEERLADRNPYGDGNGSDAEASENPTKAVGTMEEGYGNLGFGEWNSVAGSAALKIELHRG